MIFKLDYEFNGAHRTESFSKSVSLDGADAEVVNSGSRFTVKIAPKGKIRINALSAEEEYKFLAGDTLFLNGYQSWTDSHELAVTARMHGLNRAPRFLQEKYILRPYGDYDFAEYSGKRGELHGFTYAYIKRGEKLRLIASLSERFAFTQIRFRTKPGVVEIIKNCSGLVTQGEFTAFDIAVLEGDEGEVFDGWFKLMNIAPPAAKPIKGYTSWYNHYQNISEKIIFDNLEAMSNNIARFDVFQIDDGYQTAVGDWLSVDKSKFPHGMEPVAAAIAEQGMKPGLWQAPFACEFKSEIARAHPDWLLRGSNGEPVKGGGNWGGFYVLDFYNEQVRDYLRKCFDTAINKWGFKLLKLDFLYAVCLAPDESRTRGEIMCEAMDFIRENTQGAELLGCGVPLGAAFGKVDYCRIGCDVGLDYDDKPYMRLLHRERVSTRNAMLNAVGRRQLSRRAFLNDPDVFLLRDGNISLSAAQKALLARINALTGDVLFTSDNIAEYGKEQLAVFYRTLSTSPEPISVKPLVKGVEITFGDEKIIIK